MEFILILSITNSLAIFYILLVKESKYYIGIRKNETFHFNTLLGYYITLWKSTSEYFDRGIYTIYLPIRNRKKIEFEEEIQRMMQYSDSNKLQSLSTKFSWLKTEKEVEEFEKNYSVVDRKMVERLVSKWRSDNMKILMPDISESDIRIFNYKRL